MDICIFNQYEFSIKIDTATPLHSTKLLDRVKEAIRYKHYSASTEQAYVYWCRSYIRVRQLRHPKDMGSVEVTASLSYLANEKTASTSTYKQAQVSTDRTSIFIQTRSSY